MALKEIFVIESEVFNLLEHCELKLMQYHALLGCGVENNIKAEVLQSLHNMVAKLKKLDDESSFLALEKISIFIEDKRL